MSSLNSKTVLVIFMVLAMITFGSGPAGARGCGCEGAGYPDMTAFGFVTNPGCCDRDLDVGISDGNFVRKAADSDMLEVALGEMAVERASSPDVKQFGQTMAKDRALDSNKLLEIAKANNIAVPVDMDREDHEIRLQLSGMSGREFDIAYMKHLVSDHEDDLRVFEQMADQGANPDIRNYARQDLPILREHLQMARKILTRIEGRA